MEKSEHLAVHQSGVANETVAYYQQRGILMRSAQTEITAWGSTGLPPTSLLDVLADRHGCDPDDVADAVLSLLLNGTVRLDENGPELMLVAVNRDPELTALPSAV